MIDDDKFDLTPVQPDSFNAEIVSDTDDPLAKVEDIRERILKRKNILDQQYLRLGYDLFLVYKDESYKKWDYESYADYVTNEVGISIQTADDYRRLWKFYNEMCVDQDKLSGIGYTRARTIRSVLKRSNVDQWLEKARTLSFDNLRAEVKLERLKYPKYDIKNIADIKKSELPNSNMMDSTIYVDNDGPQPLVSEESPLRKEFWLYPDQLKFLLTCLHSIEKETGSSKEGYNLICAMQELMSARIERSDKSEEKPLLFMKGFELRFGGKLLWFKTDEQANLLANLINDQKDLFKGAMTNE